MCMHISSGAKLTSEHHRKAHKQFTAVRPGLAISHSRRFKQRMTLFWFTCKLFLALVGSATASRGLHASSVSSSRRSLTGPLTGTSYCTSADYGEGGKAMSAYGSTCSSLCQGCMPNTYWSLSTESGLGAAVTVTLLATDRTYKGPSKFNITVSMLDADNKQKRIWQSGPTDCVQATFISPSNVPCNRWRVDFNCLQPWASQDAGCKVQIGLKSHQPATNGVQPNSTDVVDGRCARHSPNPPSKVDRANFGVDKNDPNKNQKEYEVFNVRQQVCPGYEMDLDCCQAYRWCSGGGACSGGNSTTAFTCTVGIAQCACTVPQQTVNPAQVPSLPVYENWLRLQNQEREARRQRRQFQLEKQQAELQEQQQMLQKQIEQQERQTSAQSQQPSVLQKQLAILQEQQQDIQRDLQQVQNATGPSTELQEPPSSAVLSHMWKQLTAYYPDKDAFRRRVYSPRVLEPCLKENYTTGTLILASELAPACIDACLAGFKVWVYNGQSCNMVIMAPFAGTNSPFIPVPAVPPPPKPTFTGQGREFTETRSGLYSRQVIFKDEAPKVTSWGTGAPPGGWVATLKKAPAGVPRTNAYPPKANPDTQSQQSKRLLEFWEQVATGPKGNMTGSVGSTSNNNKAASAPSMAPPTAGKVPAAREEATAPADSLPDWGPNLECFGIVGTAEFDDNAFIQSIEGQFKQEPADDSMPWPVKFVRTADPSVFSATIGPSN